MARKADQNVTLYKCNWILFIDTDLHFFLNWLRSRHPQGEVLGICGHSYTDFILDTAPLCYCLEEFMEYWPYFSLTCLVEFARDSTWPWVFFQIIELISLIEQI